LSQHLPLSQQAFQQMQALEQMFMENPLVTEDDIWNYRWGSHFSSS
jgi:hypothetical protein